MYSRILVQVVFLCCVSTVFVTIVWGQELSTEEFLVLLESAESSIESISGHVEFYYVAENNKYMEPSVPMGEGRIAFLPYSRKLFCDIIRRVEYPRTSTHLPEDNLGYGYVPAVICVDGQVRKDYNTTTQTATVVPYVDGELIIEHMPSDLLGWNLVPVFHMPIHEYLNKGLMDWPGQPGVWCRLSIDKITRLAEHDDSVYRVEMNMVSVNDQMKESPLFKIDIDFNLDKSVRPVKIDIYEDKWGYLLLRKNQILLKELQPGIWFPVQGRSTSFSAPLIKDSLTEEEEETAKASLLIQDRQKRWESMSQLYVSYGSVSSDVRVVAEVEINSPIENSVFDLSIPPGYDVYDRFLETQYKAE